MSTQDTPLSPSDAAAETGCCGHCAAPDTTAPDTTAADASDPGAHRGTSRRRVLSRGAAVAAVGAGSLALSGCTQSIKEEENAQDHYAGSVRTPALPAADLPVGATKSVQVDGRTVLVHRKDETTVSAFSNVCTHQGCLVQVADEGQRGTVFACPCHGSHFDVETGKPYGGPARKPLMDYEAAIDGDQVVVKL